MKRKKIIIPLTIILLLAAGAAYVAYRTYKKAHRQLVHAQSLLYSYDIEPADRQFSQLLQSPWVKKEARLGSIITGIIKDRLSGQIQLPQLSDIHIQDFHILRLLHRQLRLGEFHHCITLAKVGRFYGLTAVDLFASAALLENSSVDEAKPAYNRLPQRLKETTMGRSLKEVLDLLAAGAQKIVRDRNGVLVGYVDTNNKFIFQQPWYRMFIQPVVIKNILNSSIPRSIQLTIDLELSLLSWDSLGPRKGSIVLVEPDSGDILAAVSDMHTLAKTKNSPAFQQMLEPASIMKLITVTAAMRANIDVETEISRMYCNGAKRYSGKILWCPSRGRHLRGLNHALSISCNTAFATLGVKLGWQKMLSELRLYGFDGKAGNPFSLGKIITAKGDDRKLADLSVGLENTVISPVHGAYIAAVFANQGKRPPTRLLRKGKGITGLIQQRSDQMDGRQETGGVNILAKDWLQALESAMWSVTRYGGTAQFIAPLGFPAHMKTGTGGTYRDGFHTNYIGYAPAIKGKKKIAFCVRATGRRSSPGIRRHGYSTNRELLLRLKDHSARGSY